jgi:predicted esterase
VPIGASSPRAIVIALHGSADRPEWACSALRSIAGPAPFVLCPRGIPRTDFPANDARFTFGSVDATASELRAALSELKRRFALYVAPGPVIFTGFEVGADQVAAITSQEPAFFSRVLLIEPSPSSWPSSQSSLYARLGGQRALFAFGPAHQDELRQKAVLTGRGGAEARSVFLGNQTVVPALDAATRSRIAKDFRWLAAPLNGPPVLENVAGNALAAGGPAPPPRIEKTKK